MENRIEIFEKHISLLELQALGLEAKIEALILTINDICIQNNFPDISARFDNRFFKAFERRYLELDPKTVPEVMRAAYEEIRRNV